MTQLIALLLTAIFGAYVLLARNQGVDVPDVLWVAVGGVLLALLRPGGGRGDDDDA